jgi:heavy metal translocating P-type ATPase
VLPTLPTHPSGEHHCHMTPHNGQHPGASWVRRRGSTAVLAFAVAGLAVGAVLHLSSSGKAGNLLWIVVAICGALYAVLSMVEGLRIGRVGVDVIALLAVVGAVWVSEYLAAAVIGVMIASGRSLENWAAGRARRSLRALLARAPSNAHRYKESLLETVNLASVTPGDLLMVGPGELVPVDGTVTSTLAILDESTLTGEPLPVEHPMGDAVRSGTVNAGGPFDLRSTTTSEASSYAGVVRMVTEAEASQAPFTRLADRYALWFLAGTLLVSGGSWALAGATRAVAVLVVATPCPLILAAPVALVSGVACAARRGVIVKGGGVLERLARCTTLLVDKTGTLTGGRPTLTGMVPAGARTAPEVLGMAASLDQVSPHVLATAVVRSATEQGCRLVLPTDVTEIPGLGIRGTVSGHDVAVGKAEWVGLIGSPAWARSARRQARLDGALTVFVGVDSQPAGVLIFEDPLRPDATRTMRGLRQAGIRRIVMVTGDRAEVAESVGAVIGMDQVLAERTPAEKLDAVRLESRRAPTIMVGDGVNDAPALALADVGVAMGARGASASSEAADIVLTIDRIDRIGDAVLIAHRTRRIALQSVLAGMGLSVVAMGVAAAGLLPAVWGALLQEGIDVVVIMNALRALRSGTTTRQLNKSDTTLARRFRGEHLTIRDDIDGLRTAADALGIASTEEAMDGVRHIYRLLVDEVEPHEQAEEDLLYPAIARVLGGDDPTGTMSRSHVEIAHQIRRLGQLLDDIDPEGPDGVDIIELRHLLYGLHAILRLHTTQEDESYLSLGDEPSEPAVSPVEWEAPEDIRRSGSLDDGRVGALPHDPNEGSRL